MAHDGYRTATLGDLRRPDGWAPVRRGLGIRSFGANAWFGAEVGDTVIDEHVELTHEELYLVVSGHATFFVDGEEIDAPAGAVVFVADPKLERSAVARVPDTAVFTVGAEAGVAFTPSDWELNRDVIKLLEAGQHAEARALLMRALEEFPHSGPIRFNLACAETLLGNHDAALLRLSEALALRPDLAELATEDADLAPLQADPRFALLVARGG